MVLNEIILPLLSEGYSGSQTRCTIYRYRVLNNQEMVNLVRLLFITILAMMRVKSRESIEAGWLICKEPGYDF